MISLYRAAPLYKSHSWRFNPLRKYIITMFVTTGVTGVSSLVTMVTTYWGWTKSCTNLDEALTHAGIKTSYHLARDSVAFVHLFQLSFRGKGVKLQINSQPSFKELPNI